MRPYGIGGTASGRCSRRTCAAQRVNRMRGFRHWRWHLDEMYVKLNGEMVYLWRAVDQEGEILESYITKTRDKAAALTSMKKALKRHGSPEAITTDGLRSYRAASRADGIIHGQFDRPLGLTLGHNERLACAIIGFRRNLGSRRQTGAIASAPTRQRRGRHWEVAGGRPPVRAAEPVESRSLLGSLPERDSLGRWRSSGRQTIQSSPKRPLNHAAPIACLEAWQIPHPRSPEPRSTCRHRRLKHRPTIARWREWSVRRTAFAKWKRTFLRAPRARAT
jgi:IS1 family transposase